MKCSECKHREWEEGDREHSPPGYGIYFCNLVPFPGGGLSEAVAYGREDPADCSLVETPNAEMRGASRLYGEASLSTDGLCSTVCENLRVQHGNGDPDVDECAAAIRSMK